MRVEKERNRNKEGRRAELAEGPGGLHSGGDRNREQRDDNAVAAEDQADIALAQAKVHRVERRNGHDQPHRERESETEQRETQECAVAEDRKRRAEEILSAAGTLKRQRAA